MLPRNSRKLDPGSHGRLSPPLPPLLFSVFHPMLLILWGTVVHKTYGTHKNLSLFSLGIFGLIYCGPR